MVRFPATTPALALIALLAGPAVATDKVTFHNDAARSGWNAEEKVLTPATVAGGRFGPTWQSPVLDSAGEMPPRLYATPLYLSAVDITEGTQRGRFAVVYAVTSTGYAYAINAAQTGAVAPGTILWRAKLAEAPCDEGTAGNMATPVIDRAAGRIYITACDDNAKWRLHALELGSGKPVAGWPVALNETPINRPGINRNGQNQFTDKRSNIQRGGLNLSADGKRLYVAIGPDSTGWIVAVDTQRAAVASAFSSTANVAEDQGGMWASAGPSVDAQGRVYIATGSKFLARDRKGVAGIFPDAEHNWGQSLLQFRDDRDAGLTLTATYSPFNWCQAGSADIDLGSSGTVVIDVPGAASGTPALLVLGGKQGNLYLLDRDHLPGGTIRRPPCTTDPFSDGSLLAPEVQPQFGMRGPINVFGPYSDYVSMLDQAKSRSTPAYFRDAAGANYIFATGSAKTGKDFATSAPPGLARARIVTAPGQPAYLQVDRLEETQTFHNPGSPVVSSAGGANAIVWVLDTNAPRSAPLYGEGAPKPILYAFDAATLKLLWKNAPGVLDAGGKYNEATVVDGMVLVGTDRIQAFGLRSGRVAAAPAPAKRPAAAGAKPAPRAAVAVAKPAPKPAAKPAPAAAAGPSLAAGGQIFRARCAACHATGQPGTPSRAELAKMGRAQIVAALVSGPMKAMATGMTRKDIDNVSAYLTGGK